MSTYLDELINSVEAEVAEEQTLLKALERTRRFPSKHARGGLRRALQRLESLKGLRRAEGHAAVLNPG